MRAGVIAAFSLSVAPCPRPLSLSRANGVRDWTSVTLLSNGAMSTF
jgi:hypothetical protein